MHKIEKNALKVITRSQKSFERVQKKMFISALLTLKIKSFRLNYYFEALNLKVLIQSIIWVLISDVKGIN